MLITDTSRTIVKIVYMYIMYIYIYIYIYILHLNNAFGKINKRGWCFHDIREAKIPENKNPRLTIDCRFDILAV